MQKVPLPTGPLESAVLRNWQSQGKIVPCVREFVTEPAGGRSQPRSLLGLSPAATPLLSAHTCPFSAIFPLLLGQSNQSRWEALPPGLPPGQGCRDRNPQPQLPGLPRASAPSRTEPASPKFRAPGQSPMLGSLPARVSAPLSHRQPR